MKSELGAGTATAELPAESEPAKPADADAGPS
jgi:hypothetical protein